MDDTIDTTTNVFNFVARPKQLQRNYKQHKYTVTYVPATKQWKWEIEVVQVTKYSEVADTQVKAFRAAERHIDRMKKNMGVG